MKKNPDYIFGPILSRRLGSSLGVDPVPYKTCSLDCVYCECGGTTKKTKKFDNYIDSKEIIKNLKEYLDNNPPHIDIITIAGSGEPTLNSGLGDIIEFIHLNYPQYKLGILTNSASLVNKDVRDYLHVMDYVLPSIDAMLSSSFTKVNRPADGLVCDEIIDGLREFSKEFKGNLWVEFFVLPGVNDSSEELSLFKEFFEEIKPTRVQLNGMDRPGTCSWVEAPSIERLKEIEAFFKPLPVEIISRKAKEMELPTPSSTDLESMVETIKRRPQTLEDLSVLYGLSINEADNIANSLIDEKIIVKTELNGHMFLKAVL
jgi:wyosine [tRNA(Phe)-imidazoG37] synthetase (radical SAM superfamily)